MIKNRDIILDNMKKRIKASQKLLQTYRNYGHIVIALKYIIAYNSHKSDKDLLDLIKTKLLKGN